MQRLNDKELNERIGRFMGRKMEQFPELQAIGGSENGGLELHRRTADEHPGRDLSVRHSLHRWHLSQVTR